MSTSKLAGLFRARARRIGGIGLGTVAIFEIIDTRRLGLEQSEFDVKLVEGEIHPKQIFRFEERGTVWEYVILEVRRDGETATLLCAGWVPATGAFVGFQPQTKTLNKPERKRWARALPPDF